MPNSQIELKIDSETHYFVSINDMAIWCVSNLTDSERCELLDVYCNYCGGNESCENQSLVNKLKQEIKDLKSQINYKNNY